MCALKWEVYSKINEFASRGIKFFSFRVGLFSEGDLCAGKQNVIKLPLLIKLAEDTKFIQFL